MQFLMTKTAHERVRARLATIAPQAQVITLTAPGVFECDGQPVEPGAIDPDIGWISFDSFFSRMSGSIAERITAGRQPCWLQTSNAGIDAPMYKG